MILADTSAVLHLINDRSSRHREVREAVDESEQPLLLSPFVLAELDYLIGRDIGLEGQLALLDDVTVGAYELAEISMPDLRRAREVMAQFADLRIGLADASIVALADRHDTLNVLTLDQRHFRVLLGPRDQPFHLLPADR